MLKKTIGVFDGIQTQSHRLTDYESDALPTVSQRPLILMVSNIIELLICIFLKRLMIQLKYSTLFDNAMIKTLKTTTV